jgi:hypothetical protein
MKKKNEATRVNGLRSLLRQVSYSETEKFACYQNGPSERQSASVKSCVVKVGGKSGKNGFPTWQVFAQFSKEAKE